jgi:3-hydroxyacyl-CoA dehydrogenase
VKGWKLKVFLIQTWCFNQKRYHPERLFRVSSKKAGLDTIQKITLHWARTLNDPAAEKRAAFLEKLTAQGFCGAKTNRGFYTYPDPAYTQADFLQKIS